MPGRELAAVSVDVMRKLDEAPDYPPRTGLGSQCHACLEVQPIEDFYVNKRDGRTRQCKRCQISKHSAWAKANRGRMKALHRAFHARHPEASRTYHLRRKYNLSIQDFDAMVAAQQGVCAVCALPPTKGRWSHLYIDHDHASGRVRGLLCDSCNRGAGFLGDNPQRARALALYLETR